MKYIRIKVITKNTNIQGIYIAITTESLITVDIDSNKTWKNQGSSSSTTKTSFDNLFMILPLGFLSKNYILLYIIDLLSFLNSL